jgi:hypothetical protein
VLPQVNINTNGVSNIKTNVLHSKQKLQLLLCQMMHVQFHVLSAPRVLLLLRKSIHPGMSILPISLSVDRFAKAVEQRMFLVGVVEDVNSNPLHRRYQIWNSNCTDVYTVDIKREVQCSCPDFQQNGFNRCKHLLYVLIRVLRCIDLLAELRRQKLENSTP